MNYWSLHITLLIFVPFFCKAQIWETDTRYIEHWQHQPDASIYFFEYDDFAGLLLDGNVLIETDVFLLRAIKRITGMEIDTATIFDFTIDTTTVFQFERRLRDTLSRNDTLLLPSSQFFNEVLYFRQYLPLQDKNSQYLLVSLQLDRGNLLLKDGIWNRKNLEERSYKQYLLVNTRLFETGGLDILIRSDDLFYVLYDVNADGMKFFYVGKKMKN